MIRLSGGWTNFRWFWLALLLCSVCATYSNHFHNSFHFDDAHTIIDNPSIRTLKNIPRFFSDVSTFSVLPANRSWRPLISASLALDYWVGGGLNPVAFHVSTFVWYLLQISLLFLLFERVFDYARPEESNRLPALFAAAWYGLHPACAETVNYVIQRGDLYSTLGVVAGLYLFVSRPAWRKYGVYLLPVLAAQLSKPPALVFPVLLFIYIYLFEDNKLVSAFRAALPALILSAVVGLVQAHMTPSTFVAGASSPALYRITQPYVALRYFESFFLPTRLSVDTDLGLFSSALQPQALAGFLFVAAISAAAMWCSRHRETKPVAFGLWWFLLALVPTSLFALAEVENDHRMFFPFVGLVISVVWTLTLAMRVAPAALRQRSALPLTAAALLLTAYAYGAHQRNEVWRSDASLWRDATLKSPNNGRALMNFGLTLMSAGDLPGAVDYFRRAQAFVPNYDILEINLGVAYGELRNDAESEQHFQRAMALAPQSALPYYYYGRWLDARGRTHEALIRVQKALTLNPSNPDAQDLLRKIQTVNERAAEEIVQFEQAAAADPTAEKYLNLSLRYHQAGRYSDCIRAAREALKRKPGYAEALNNLAAGHEALGQWDDAIRAAREALRLRPDFTLAQNNLEWSTAQKAAAAKVNH